MTDKLRAMLQNVMGHIDTPIARRRLGIGVDQPEWLTEARAALAAAPQPTGCGLPCGFDCNGACFDAAAPQPAPDQAEDESRVCLHCGVQTRARFDPCWRCGLWHSRLVADGYKRLQARVDRSAPQPATPGERMIRAAEEAVAIARGEAEPASVYPAPQPAPEQGMTRAEVGQMLDGKRHDREALVEVIEDALYSHSDERGWELTGTAQSIADALLARGMRLPV